VLAELGHLFHLWLEIFERKRKERKGRKKKKKRRGVVSMLILLTPFLIAALDPLGKREKKRGEREGGRRPAAPIT